MDLVKYLCGLGFNPAKIHGNKYWYFSPLRNERTPSFKIDRSFNRWYGHGIGKGGNLIDFAILYHNCTIKELLQNLQGNFSFQKASFDHSAQSDRPNKITVQQDFVISSCSLISYLKQRNIPVEIAARYCREVRYQLGEKTYFAIGLKNDAGGFELRNQYFKHGSSPKDVTTIKNGAVKCAVFEGLFDFLSFLSLIPEDQYTEWDFCILNSLSFFKKVCLIPTHYNSIHLFLDNDKAGQNCSHSALLSDKRFVDESILYRGYKDLNDWIINMGK